MSKGIHVLIREGSCTKDANALLPLLNSYTSPVLSLCSDDRNPADIAEGGHINCIIDMALARGARPEDIFRAASYATAKTYGLEDRGAVAPGYKADLVLISPKDHAKGDGDWRHGTAINQVFKSGEAVTKTDLRAISRQKKSHFDGINLDLAPVTQGDFKVRASTTQGSVDARVIGIITHQILTNELICKLPVTGGLIQPDLGQDILKIAVLERHHGSGGKAIGFAKGMGLKSGAIATSINHDSHNVITIGSSDELIASAVNELIRIDGGIVVVHADGRKESLPLPIGGLMTDADPDSVTATLLRLKALTRDAGCQLNEPFLQLSFLALPVIPSLKITDKGLVKVMESKLVSLTV
jgi:adenine deaminase